MDESGNPVFRAKLSIDDRYITFRSSKFGEYWRLLLPGNYILKVSVRIHFFRHYDQYSMKS